MSYVLYGLVSRHLTVHLLDINVMAAKFAGSYVKIVADSQKYLRVNLMLTFLSIFQNTNFTSNILYVHEKRKAKENPF